MIPYLRKEYNHRRYGIEKKLCGEFAHIHIHPNAFCSATPRFTFAVLRYIIDITQYESKSSPRNLHEIPHCEKG